jgi:hypothetical protein
MSARPNERLAYIGKCIYCGSDEDLTDEHMLAAGFNGYYVLEDASCGVCARITSGMETKFLSATRTTRSALGMGAKRRKTVARTAPVWVTVKGVRQKEYLPVHESILPVLFPIFPRAGWAKGRAQSEALVVDQIPAVITFGKSPLEVMDRFGADQVSVDQPIPAVDFARLVAKTAYCYAVAKFGLDAFKNVGVLPAILGTAEDIGFWVGTFARERPSSPDPTLIHRLNIGVLSNSADPSWDRMVTALVMLFANAPAPVYEVVVGSLKPDVTIPPNVGVADLSQHQGEYIEPETLDFWPNGATVLGEPETRP